MRTLAITTLLTLTLTACNTTPPPETPGYTTNSPEAYKIEKESVAALEDLYAHSPDALKIGRSAIAVLVFPNVTKGGFGVGGQAGRGALFYRGTGLGGYFSTVSATYGMQIGLQQFGYALFIMDEESLAKLKNSAGWEIGSGPNLTVLDMGTARSISNYTAHSGVYAFFFNQKGLMAGLGLQGTKITRIYP
jgi:lipid-binding SYLF domain-containing protein